MAAVSPVNNRGGSSCNYNVVINNVSVALTAEAGPAFRNTLSAGDRNTLALAFFFASLDQDPQLAQKIVVIDDPMTSLDEHRSLTTVQEMRRLVARVRQVIVLSHSKPFLCQLWEGADTAARQAILSLDIDRGYVRTEDEAPIEPESETGVEAGGKPADPVVQRAVITIGGQPAEPEDDEDDGIKPLPDRLVTELTAHRTLALRNALADNPHVAMTALLHKLVSDTFQHRMYKGAMEASINHVFFPVQDEALKDSPSARAIHERHEGWAGDIPADDDALWDWLVALDDTSRMALLAHCVSYGVNALYEKPNPYSGSGVSQHTLDTRLAQADRLARATGLDMVEVGWRPTVGNYLGRVTKHRILQAVREGAGEQAAQLIDHLKKGDMAKEAERLLADTGWLPEPLRLVHDAEVFAPDTQTRGEDEGAALPEFLAGDDEEIAADAEDEERHLVAAE